jgi:hypothetical protein
MSPRKLLRIVLSVVILVLLWMRVLRQWRYESRLWLVGSITLSLLLILVVSIELVGVVRKPRNLRDEVPKRPLGLDS